MKKMFLLFSHNLTEAQKENAQKVFGINEFIALPDNLQKLWSNIPPHLETLEEYLMPIKKFFRDNVDTDDIVLIQGDFGGCYEMVNFVKELGAIAVHATTKRDSIEKVIDGKVIKTSRFEHVIFRKY